MKLFAQTMLCITMACSALLWLLNASNIELYMLAPVNAIAARDGDYHEGWMQDCDELNLQKVTHADEVFWVCLCALILTIKVKQ